jgi:iron-sulfur cluster assembly accessory protein
VVVDPLSAPYLQGTQIDFVEGLQGGFAINNPNVTSACGCGHSFQVEEGAEGEVPADGPPCGSGC